MHDDLKGSKGKIELKLADCMKKNNISIYRLSKLSGIKYDVVKRYYYNENYLYSFDILAKFCDILKCDIGEILIYINE